MSQSACSVYTGYRFPLEIISDAVWLYFRFPLSLRMVEEMLAARDIVVSHGAVQQQALTFGQVFASEIRGDSRRQLRATAPVSPRLLEARATGSNSWAEAPAPCLLRSGSWFC